MSSPCTASRARASGFTLIEVLVTVVIVGILASIALPSYTDYVRRSKIIEATSRLADQRVRMEQHFLDNRTYAGAPSCVDSTTEFFTIKCVSTATTYLVTATGKSGTNMDGFEYTINQANTRTSKTYWGTTSASCWIVRKGSTDNCS